MTTSGPEGSHPLTPKPIPESLPVRPRETEPVPRARPEPGDPTAPPSWSMPEMTPSLFPVPELGPTTPLVRPTPFSGEPTRRKDEWFSPPAGDVNYDVPAQPGTLTDEELDKLKFEGAGLPIGSGRAIVSVPPIAYSAGVPPKEFKKQNPRSEQHNPSAAVSSFARTLTYPKLKRRLGWAARTPSRIPNNEGLRIGKRVLAIAGWAGGVAVAGAALKTYGLDALPVVREALALPSKAVDLAGDAWEASSTPGKVLETGVGIYAAATATQVVSSVISRWSKIKTARAKSRREAVKNQGHRKDARNSPDEQSNDSK